MLFDANRARLGEVEQELGAQSDELQERRTRLTFSRTELRRPGSAEIDAELRSLQSRPNLLPLPQLELRRRLCDGTGIAETALPYAGELLRVRDGEGAWEGAAERTLHGFALSLLVPAEHYAAVSSWVDANNLRGRLVYLRIGDSPAARTAEPGTLAAKIAIKPGTPFRNFLLDELATRFDHVCCDTLEDFRRYPKALTVNGQLKGGRGRHEKDDRRELTDRRNYVLGWDNHDKISRFLAEQDEVKGQLAGHGDPAGQRSTRPWAIWAGGTSSSERSAPWPTSPRSAGSSPPGGSRSSRPRRSNWSPPATCCSSSRPRNPR